MLTPIARTTFGIPIIEWVSGSTMVRYYPRRRQVLRYGGIWIIAS